MNRRSAAASASATEPSSLVRTCSGRATPMVSSRAHSQDVRRERPTPVAPTTATPLGPRLAARAASHSACRSPWRPASFGGRTPAMAGVQGCSGSEASGGGLLGSTRPLAPGAGRKAESS